MLAIRLFLQKREDVKMKKQKQLGNIVLILVVLVAVGSLYYIWQAQVGPGQSYAGIKALGEIYQKKYERGQFVPGGPITERPAMVLPARAIDGACCNIITSGSGDVYYQTLQVPTGQRCPSSSIGGTFKIEVKGGRCPG